MQRDATLVYEGAGLGDYGYDEKPWFLPGRIDRFIEGFEARGLRARVSMVEASKATDADLLLFHTREHVDRVVRLCAAGVGALDHGPTFARPRVERGARHVVGAVMDATRTILAGEARRAFVPIAGFHHAFANEARSYCLYNDAAIAIAFLLAQGVAPIAYIDVDVHQGDGVLRAFEADPRVLIADVHEDWSTLFPHTPEAPGTGDFNGRREHAGTGEAVGTKLNVALKPGAGDAELDAAWAEVKRHLAPSRPRFFVLVAGADGVAGDPLAHLRYTPNAIRRVVEETRALADESADGRLLVLGGGGYDEGNMVETWCGVVEALLAT